MSNVMDNYAEQPRPLTVVIDNSTPCVASRLHAHESLADGFRLEVSLLSVTPLTPALLGKLVVVSYQDHDIIRTFAGLAEQLECEGFHRTNNTIFTVSRQQTRSHFSVTGSKGGCFRIRTAKRR